MATIGLYLATCTAFFISCCSSTPDIHRQMSPDELRSIFHVDHVDLVPNYEIVHLIHQTPIHRVRKRAINSAQPAPGLGFDQMLNSVADDSLKTVNHESKRHGKKDLSKNAYHSDVKKKPAKSGGGAENSDNNKFSLSSISESSVSVTSDKPISTSASAANLNLNNNNNNLSGDYANVEVDKNGKIDMDANLNGVNENDDGIKRVEVVLDLPRGEHNVTFTAFGQELNLKLKPTEGPFKNGGPHSLRMWTVKTNPNATQGLDYEEVVEEKANEAEHIGEIYQDEANMAAILMRRHLETGDLMMEGSIGHDMIIRPISPEVLHPLNPDGKSVHHVVFKRESDPIEQLSDFAYMEPDRLQKRFRRKRSFNASAAGELEDAEFAESNYYRAKRQIPHIIYPEILVIVDYDGYRLHGGDNVQVKRYFVSFWNGVDLRYRLLKGPRIRISIAGIIISRGRDATPYLERNRVGRDAIDSAAALTDMGKYLFRERRLPVYDIAVAITKLDMCRRQYANDVCNRGTAGFAYVGGACVVNKRLEKVNSVAIIEDTGGFSGIIVAAHEVGHLLGAVHDGSPPPSYLGGPGAEKCRWEDGYIMSDLRHTERGFRWSPCSIQSFHHFLNGDTATCLHNAPHEDEALGRALPGTLLSLDAQCRRDRGTSACFKDERVCAQLFCFDAASGYCVAYRPAAEGSSCGDGLHCLDGRCVAEHENIIPDYSQHTPSYASPNSYNQQYNTESYNYYYEDDSATTIPPTAAPPPPQPVQRVFSTSTSGYTTRNYFNNLFYNSFQQIKSTTTTQSPYSYNSYFSPSPSPVITTTPVPNVYNNVHDNYYNTQNNYYSTTEKPATKINPFYYGLHNNQQHVETTKNYYSSYQSPSTTSTPSPYYNNYNSNDYQYDVTGTSSSTRNPVFDVYLSRKASSTKNPYNFENFGVYNKQSTAKYSYNQFGANSNLNAQNISLQYQQQSS